MNRPPKREAVDPDRDSSSGEDVPPTMAQKMFQEQARRRETAISRERVLSRIILPRERSRSPFDSFPIRRAITGEPASMRTNVTLQHRGSVYAGKRLTMNSQSDLPSQPPAKRQKVDRANPYLSATGPPFRGPGSRKNKDGLPDSSSSSTQLSKKGVGHITSPSRSAPIEVSDDELDTYTEPAPTFKGKAPIRAVEAETAVATAFASAHGPVHSAWSSAGQSSIVKSVPAPAVMSMRPAASTSVPIQEVTATPTTPAHSTPVPPRAVDGGVPAQEQSISDSAMNRLLDLRERSLKVLTEEQLPDELRAENIKKLLARVAANILDPRVA